MAYTYNVDASTPTGATAANTADEEFRAIKGAFIERMADIVGGTGFDINTDPIVPAGASLLDPTVNTNFLMTPYILTKSPSAQHDIYGSITDFTPGGSAGFVIPLWFKPGVAITDVTLYFNRSDVSDSINMVLYRKAWPNTIELLYSSSVSTFGPSLVLNCSNHVMVAGMAYWVNVNYAVGSGDVNLYGVKVQLV